MLPAAAGETVAEDTLGHVVALVVGDVVVVVVVALGDERQGRWRQHGVGAAEKFEEQGWREGVRGQGGVMGPRGAVGFLWAAPVYRLHSKEDIDS